MDLDFKNIINFFEEKNDKEEENVLPQLVVALK